MGIQNQDCFIVFLASLTAINSTAYLLSFIDNLCGGHILPRNLSMSRDICISPGPTISRTPVSLSTTLSSWRAAVWQCRKNDRGYHAHGAKNCLNQDLSGHIWVLWRLPDVVRGLECDENSGRAHRTNFLFRHSRRKNGLDIAVQLSFIMRILRIGEHRQHR